jgi:hypothetical protein
MTNWKTETTTGTIETKAQSNQSSLDLVTELMSAYITMTIELKKLTDWMEASCLHFESVKSSLLKLADEMETMGQRQ